MTTTEAVLEKGEVVKPIQIPTREFSFHDRCDRCGFQAYIVAQKTTCEQELEITLCGHHGRESAPGLAADGWSVLDFTDRINEKPSPSASEID